MKLNVETPRQLIDINGLPLNQIERVPNGGLKIGALARNSDVAHHEAVQTAYPVLSQAILAGASTQLRNIATTAGNLLQKTRCVYYRDVASGCNKRQPGTGCSAIGGHNRMLAILGTSDQCIASNPSDQNVALVALEATIHVTGTKGERAIPIGQFYTLPGQTPERETVLEPGDLVPHVTLPPLPSGATSLYLRAARPRILRIRACISGYRREAGPWPHRICTRSPRWSRNDTVAQPRSREGLTG